MAVRSVAALTMLVASISLPMSASAHVGVTPATAPPDSNQTFTVRVPTEKEEPTVRVRVDFPAGLTVSRFQPKPGWTRQVERDAQQRVISVTWSGGQIAPGEYDDFSFIARTPRETGKLVFKAFQTYQGGETVEWVNEEGQDRPAAVVSVSPAAGGSASGSGVSIEGTGGLAPSAAPAAATGPTVAAAPDAPARTAPAASSGSDMSLLLAMGAIGLAAVALALAGVALLRRPRSA